MHFPAPLLSSGGADCCDRIFDDSLRNQLTDISAPTPIASRDIYRLCKRYMTDDGYDNLVNAQDNGQLSLPSDRVRCGNQQPEQVLLVRDCASQYGAGG